MINIKPNENDIIIDYDTPKFKKGFIPKPEQSMYYKCDECGYLHKVELGRGDIGDSDNNCLNCGEYLGDCSVTAEIFDAKSGWFLYKDKAMLDKYNRPESDFNIRVSKAIGESYIEDTWDISDLDLMCVNDYLEGKGRWGVGDFILIAEEDSVILLYLLYNNTPLDIFYVIDKDFHIKKLEKINISISLN